MPKRVKKDILQQTSNGRFLLNGKFASKEQVAIWRTFHQKRVPLTKQAKRDWSIAKRQIREQQEATPSKPVSIDLWDAVKDEFSGQSQRNTRIEYYPNVKGGPTLHKEYDLDPVRIKQFMERHAGRVFHIRVGFEYSDGTVRWKQTKGTADKDYARLLDTYGKALFSEYRSLTADNGATVVAVKYVRINVYDNVQPGWDDIADAP